MAIDRRLIACFFQYFFLVAGKVSLSIHIKLSELIKANDRAPSISANQNPGIDPNVDQFGNDRH